jgi:hypothetical protein
MPCWQSSFLRLWFICKEKTCYWRIQCKHYEEC